MLLSLDHCLASYLHLTHRVCIFLSLHDTIWNGIWIQTWPHYLCTIHLWMSKLNLWIRRNLKSRNQPHVQNLKLTPNFKFQLDWLFAVCIMVICNYRTAPVSFWLCMPPSASYASTFFASISTFPPVVSMPEALSVQLLNYILINIRLYSKSDLKR